LITDPIPKSLEYLMFTLKYKPKNLIDKFYPYLSLCLSGSDNSLI